MFGYPVGRGCPVMGPERTGIGALDRFYGLGARVDPPAAADSRPSGHGQGRSTACFSAHMRELVDEWTRMGLAAAFRRHDADLTRSSTRHESYLRAPQ